MLRRKINKRITKIDRGIARFGIKCKRAEMKFEKNFTAFSTWFWNLGN